MSAVFVCVFKRVPERFQEDLGSGNGVKKESFLCAALKMEKRVSIAPVRADHMSGGPRNSKKRVVFCKCFSNRLAERFS